MEAKKPRGFATFSPEEHRKISSRGGKKSGIKKGFSLLTPERRREISVKATEARWGKNPETNVKEKI